MGKVSDLPAGENLRGALNAAVALSPADPEERRVAVALALAAHAPALRDAVDVLVRFALGASSGIEVSAIGQRLVRGMQQSTPPRPRPVHKADAVDINGRVSAICLMSRRAIDLKRATWTLRDEAVTCPKCLARMGHAARQADRREAARGSD